MDSFFEQLSVFLSVENPILQGIAAAFGTFVLEDPTSIGCGLLVADGKMMFLTAWVGLAAGIAIGDLGLYGLGRFLGTAAIDRGYISRAALKTHRRRLNDNLLAVVLSSRFVPGMRLPTYVGAGVLRADLFLFMTWVVGASLMWTLALLSLTVAVGEGVFPLLGAYRWPVGFGILGLAVGAQWVFRSRTSEIPVSVQPKKERVVSPFEFWHPAIFYVPVALKIIRLAIRHRSLMLPTLADPKIYTGGMIGESKSQILDLVGNPGRNWIAPYVPFVKPSGPMKAVDLVEEALAAIEREGIMYPFVAKPDLGQRGAGVRLIRKRRDLADYLQEFPSGQKIVFQRLAPGWGEAGILYYRIPDEGRGRIFSITLKEFPFVVGDGAHTLRNLIEMDPRARRIRKTYFKRHKESLAEVLGEGEKYPLVFAGNHAQGCVFKNGKHLATTRLLDRIEEIAREIPEFYFGRFDVRFENEDQLKQGGGFTIVEINGAGAEATHIWDAQTTLREAYRTLFQQFEILFRIGAENRKRGFEPIGPVRFTKEFFRYLRLARSYPSTD